MKEDYLSELENQINIQNVDGKADILEKYRKRYDFGLEAGMSCEEIEKMLGEPREIIAGYRKQKESKPSDEDSKYADLMDKMTIDVQTLSEDVEIIYSDDLEYHAEFENVEPDLYEIEKTDTQIKIRYKKRKFFSLNRKKGGLIRIEIPRGRALKEFNVSTASGDIDIPSIKTEKFELGLVSGDCSFEDIEAKEVSFGIVSGDIDGKNLKAKDVKMDTVSGDISINFVVCESLKADTISGDIILREVKGNVSSTSVSGDVLINGEPSGTNVKNYVKGLFRS